MCISPISRRTSSRPATSAPRWRPPCAPARRGATPCWSTSWAGAPPGCRIWRLWAGSWTCSTGPGWAPSCAGWGRTRSLASPPAAWRTASCPRGRRCWRRRRSSWGTCSAPPPFRRAGCGGTTRTASGPISSTRSTALSTISGFTPPAACWRRCAPGSPTPCACWGLRRTWSASPWRSWTPTTAPCCPRGGWSCSTAAPRRRNGWPGPSPGPSPPCPGRAHWSPYRPSAVPPGKPAGW